MGEIDAAVKWSTEPFSGWILKNGCSSLWGGGGCGNQPNTCFPPGVSVQRSGHRAVPGNLPDRPHHAGHGRQRPSGCECASGRGVGFEPSDELTSSSSFGRTATSTLTKGEGWVLQDGLLTPMKKSCLKVMLSVKKEKADKRKSLQEAMKVQQPRSDPTSLFIGVWGFSSDPPPAVFLQKLRLRQWWDLPAVVPQRAHAHRGAEVPPQPPHLTLIQSSM